MGISGAATTTAKMACPPHVGCDPRQHCLTATMLTGRNLDGMFMIRPRDPVIVALEGRVAIFVLNVGNLDVGNHQFPSICSNMILPGIISQLTTMAVPLRCCRTFVLVRLTCVLVITLRRPCVAVRGRGDCDDMQLYAVAKGSETGIRANLTAIKPVQYDCDHQNREPPRTFHLNLRGLWWTRRSRASFGTSSPQGPSHHFSSLSRPDEGMAWSTRLLSPLHQVLVPVAGTRASSR